MVALWTRRILGNLLQYMERGRQWGSHLVLNTLRVD